MTNKEKYQRAFSVLHTSDEFRMEVSTMKQKTRKAMPRLVAVCAAVILVIGMSAVAYAADVGGIQRTIQIWLHGEQTDAVLDIQNGEYSLTYEGEDGATHEIAGGGVACGVGMYPVGYPRCRNRYRQQRNNYGPRQDRHGGRRGYERGRQ